jgi:hypothetical protein
MYDTLEQPTLPSRTHAPPPPSASIPSASGLAPTVPCAPQVLGHVSLSWMLQGLIPGERLSLLTVHFGEDAWHYCRTGVDPVAMHQHPAPAQAVPACCQGETRPLSGTLDK